MFADVMYLRLHNCCHNSEPTAPPVQCLNESEFFVSFQIILRGSRNTFVRFSKHLLLLCFVVIFLICICSFSSLSTEIHY